MSFGDQVSYRRLEPATWAPVILNKGPNVAQLVGNLNCESNRSRLILFAAVIHSYNAHCLLGTEETQFETGREPCQWSSHRHGVRALPSTAPVTTRTTHRKRTTRSPLPAFALALH